jgi:hypothetical protein
MKNLFTLLVILLFCFTSQAQVTEPDTTTETTMSATQADSIVKSGVTYKLYTGSRGGVYILRTSSKTGKEYKQYIKKEELTKLVNNYSLVKN